MSTKEGETTEWAGEPERSSGFKVADVGWSVYRPIAAVYAALGIAEIIRHYWSFEWNEPLASIVKLWEGARAFASTVFHVVVTIPSEWFGGHLEVPLGASDYLSVGVLLALRYVAARGSLEDFFVREYEFSEPGNEPISVAEFQRRYPRRRPPSLPVQLTALLTMWPIFVVAIPAVVLIRHNRKVSETTRTFAKIEALLAERPELGSVFDDPVEHAERSIRMYRRSSFYKIGTFAGMVSPLLYLALLLALNFVVF